MNSKISREQIQAAVGNAIGRGSSQGVYSNLQIRAGNYMPSGGSQERINNTQLVSTTLGIPQALNLSSQSLERPVSSQSNGRKPQTFLTP
jgi:hypothetical protein